MLSPSFEFDRGLVWFRRDLRAADHAALYHALKRCRAVWCLFVFDTEILDPLLARGLVRDRRVEFIRASGVELAAALPHGLIARHGRARDIVVDVARTLGVDAVFANRDYEPAANERDAEVERRLARDDRAFHRFKDQVIFDTDEVLTKAGTPFTVFTPYKRAWHAKLAPFFLKAYPVERHAAQLAPIPRGARGAIPSLAAMGFAATNLADVDIPAGTSGALTLVDAFADSMRDYQDGRNPPARRGTSYLSVHLRFGTISVRALARNAWDRAHRGAAAGRRGADTWLGELVWRDFYFQVLHHRPDLASGASFKPAFDRVRWIDGAHGDRLFDAWCRGATGYPLVDAAMTQINTSGFMHNRLRMVTASFLAKDLGVDWRRGERYFAEQLNDFEFANNNGGWQWSAGCGCDAQPWFRIFNPVEQSKRYDPDGAFIRRYLPGLATLSNKAIHAPWLADPRELARAGVVLGRDYPEPIVDHKEARRAALERFAVVRSAARAAT